MVTGFRVRFHIPVRVLLVLPIAIYVSLDGKYRDAVWPPNRGLRSILPFTFIDILENCTVTVFYKLMGNGETSCIVCPLYVYAEFKIELLRSVLVGPCTNSV